MKLWNIAEGDRDFLNPQSPEFEKFIIQVDKAIKEELRKPNVRQIMNLVQGND